MKRKIAKNLMEKTKKDYNTIGKDYARTRSFTWDVEHLAEYASNHDKILDLGCGNGRLLEVLKNKDIEYTGIDASKELIKIAKENYLYPPEFLQSKKSWRAEINFQIADALKLPFPDNYFHKIFAIRIFHHFPSIETRKQFLKEAKRVLKPNGILILTVWSVWSSKNKKGLSQIIKNYFLKIIGKSQLNFGDALIPWQNKTLRYYHFFTKNELKNLVKKAELKIKNIYTTPARRCYSVAGGPARRCYSVAGGPDKKKKYSDIYIIAQKEKGNKSL